MIYSSKSISLNLKSNETIEEVVNKNMVTLLIPVRSSDTMVLNLNNYGIKM